MQTLVSCSHCSRQYDAGGLTAGDRFRCLCGQPVDVPRVKASDASVIRCSSCGGPRMKSDPRCRFCEAEFTLHELDLHTICPECMTRVSDKAKFCHHCGVGIHSVGSAGLPTDLNCPVCDGRKLHDRTLGATHAMECSGCAGLWMDLNVFQAMLTKARSGPTTEPFPSSRTTAPTVDIPATNQPLYRRCPRCSTMMARRNFAKRSGVILDHCNEHGVWFDVSELDRILKWVQVGGEAKALAAEAKVRSASRERNALDRKLDQMTGTATGGFSGSKPSTGVTVAGDVLGALLDGAILFDLFD